MVAPPVVCVSRCCCCCCCLLLLLLLLLHPRHTQFVAIVIVISSFLTFDWMLYIVNDPYRVRCRWVTCLNWWLDQRRITTITIITWERLRADRQWQTLEARPLLRRLPVAELTLLARRFLSPISASLSPSRNSKNFLAGKSSARTYFFLEQQICRTVSC